MHKWQCCVVVCSVFITFIMTTHDEKNDPQMLISEENTLDNAFAKCRLAAGVFKNDIEVPWMNFEKVFLIDKCRLFSLEEAFSGLETGRGGPETVSSRGPRRQAVFCLDQTRGRRPRGWSKQNTACLRGQRGQNAEANVNSLYLLDVNNRLKSTTMFPFFWLTNSHSDIPPVSHIFFLKTSLTLHCCN